MHVVLNLQRGTCWVECPRIVDDDMRKILREPADGRANRIKQAQEKLRAQWIEHVYRCPRHEGNAYTNPAWTDPTTGRLSADKRDTFLPDLIGGQARVLPTAMVLSGMQSFRGLEAMACNLLDRG